MPIAPPTDELARLRAVMAAQQIRLARLERRRRFPRRFLPLAAVALLAALLPLSLLAATPVFSDLGNAAPIHQPNIQALAAAGITTGFADPNSTDPDARLYDPKATVTREEMASFLARTTGLGENAPVANAKTAQTADQATNAINATNAQHAVIAQTATTATNDTNADKLDGYDANALNRIAFSTTALVNSVPVDQITTVGKVTITVPGPAPQAVHVRGALNLYSGLSGGYVRARVIESADSSVGFSYFPYLTNAPGVGLMVYSDFVFTAAPGAHTYRFEILQITPGPLATRALTLTATTHPFGSGGGAGATEIEPAPPEPAR